MARKKKAAKKGGRGGKRSAKKGGGKKGGAKKAATAPTEPVDAIEIPEGPDPDEAATVIDVPEPSPAGNDTVLELPASPQTTAPAEADAADDLPDELLWDEAEREAEAVVAEELPVAAPEAPPAEPTDDAIEEIPEIPDAPDSDEPPDLPAVEPETVTPMVVVPEDLEELDDDPATASDSGSGDDPASASDTLPPLDELAADAPPDGAAERAGWIETGVRRADQVMTAHAEAIGLVLLERDDPADRSAEVQPLWDRAAELRTAVQAHAATVADARATADDAADAWADARREALAHERRRDQALEQLQVGLRALGEHLLSTHRPQLAALELGTDDDPRLPLVAALEEADEADAELADIPPPPPRKGLTRILSKPAPDPRAPLIAARDRALERFRELVRGLGREACGLVDTVGSGCANCASARQRVEEHAGAADVAVTALQGLELDALRQAAESGERALRRLAERLPEAVTEWGRLAPEVGGAWCEARLAASTAATSADESAWRDARALRERFAAYASALADELRMEAIARANEHTSRLEAVIAECAAATAELDARKEQTRAAAHRAIAAWSKRERDVATRADTTAETHGAREEAATASHQARIEALALGAAQALQRVESARADIDARIASLDQTGERVDAVVQAVEHALAELDGFRTRLPDLMAVSGQAEAVTRQIEHAREQIDGAMAEAQRSLATHAAELQKHREGQTDAIVKAVKQRAARATKELEDWLKKQAQSQRPRRAR